MTLTDIANTRLISQQLAATKFKSPKEIVGWMGAMQAQDYPMAKWAVGIRLRNSTEEKIEAAIDKGEIIRTHVLRPTWHFVSRDDIYWMLELTAAKIKAVAKLRHKELEISEAILKKSSKIIEKALLNHNHLTRDELIQKFQKAKIATDEYRSGHIMLWAELNGLVCSGAIKNKKQTYALLEERIPKPKSLSRDEALAKLARRYFSSHFPATLPDFTWWSGLSVSEAKKALEFVKSEFSSEKNGSATYWFPNSFRISKNQKQSIYLLPSYDEFLISYKDRSASLHIDHRKNTVSSNGIFWPTVVINGQVKGKWKRTTGKENVIIETAFFKPADKTIKRSLEKEAAAYGHFLDKKAELIFK